MAKQAPRLVLRVALAVLGFPAVAALLWFGGISRGWNCNKLTGDGCNGDGSIVLLLLAFALWILIATVWLYGFRETWQFLLPPRWRDWPPERRELRKSDRE